MLGVIFLIVCFGLIFTLGMIIGQRTEQNKLFEKNEEIVVDEPKPLVTYKDRKKIYRQLGSSNSWHIDD